MGSAGRSDGFLAATTSRGLQFPARPDAIETFGQMDQVADKFLRGAASSPV